VPGRACLRIYDDEHESDGEAIHRIEKKPGIHHLLQPGLQHINPRNI